MNALAAIALLALAYHCGDLTRPAAEAAIQYESPSLPAESITRAKALGLALYRHAPIRACNLLEENFDAMSEIMRLTAHGEAYAS